jgi:hypothetical protein
MWKRWWFPSLCLSYVFTGRQSTVRHFRLILNTNHDYSVAWGCKNTSGQQLLTLVTNTCVSSGVAVQYESLLSAQRYLIEPELSALLSSPAPCQLLEETLKYACATPRLGGGLWLVYFIDSPISFTLNRPLKICSNVTDKSLKNRVLTSFNLCFENNVHFQWIIEQHMGFHLKQLKPMKTITISNIGGILNWRFILCSTYFWLIWRRFQLLRLYSVKLYIAVLPKLFSTATQFLQRQSTATHIALLDKIEAVLKNIYFIYYWI